MKRRSSIPWLVAAVLAVTGFMIYLHFHNRAATLQSSATAEAGDGKIKTIETSPAVAADTVAGTTQTNQVFRVFPDRVLATVNGTPLSLRELIPLNNTNAEQEISQVTYHYFLERAINRELIMQAAKAQGVALTEAQEQQLAGTRALREQPEPGLIDKLTVNAAEIEFECRDATAFVLQTTLMAQMGATPNVTPEQVSQYYQGHISEFGELPADPQARQEAWQGIDFQIRQQLASQTRNQYNKQLQKFMDNLRTAAQINVTPLL